MSPALSLALRARLDPRRIVLGDVELLELCPRSDCLCTRHSLIRCEELGDEVDVATVKDLLEALHLGSIRSFGLRPRSTSFTPVLRSERFVGNAALHVRRNATTTFSSSSFPSFFAAGMPMCPAKIFNCSRYQ